jgi:hypothetical protein
MLGDKIGEFHGEITGNRVLAPEGNHPKLESSSELHGTVLNIPARISSTYWSIVAPDGTFYGESPLQSLTVTEDGDMGLFRGAGAGQSGRGMQLKFRGAIFYLGATGKLATLNSQTLVFEWDQDQDGIHFNFWQWK